MKRAIPFLIALGLAALAAYWWWPAQAPVPPHVVALVQLTEVDSNTVAGFKAGLAEAGYREGREVVYLTKGPVGSIDRLDAVIGEYLAGKPDLIMVSSTPATQAVKRLTQGMGIPVVFAPVNDPLNAGIVTDLRHPGGDITGIRLPTGDDLRLKWLSDIVPGIRRVFVPYTPGDKSAEATLGQIAAVAPNLKMDILSRPVPDQAGMEAELAALPAGVGAIFLPRDSSVEARIETLVAFADDRRLPLCGPSYTQVAKGALMSYGFVHEEIGRQAARQAAQIFAGVRPGDLPVEMAENKLIINVAAARRIGLTIPDEILRQADKIVRE